MPCRVRQSRWLALDNNGVASSIAFNTLRSGAAHEFPGNDGYARPKFLTSVAYPVKPGETISLTSAYGGTLQVHFDTNDIDVELRFWKCRTAPVWRSEADNDSFSQHLARRELWLGWAADYPRVWSS